MKTLGIILESETCGTHTANRGKWRFRPLLLLLMAEIWRTSWGWYIVYPIFNRVLYIPGGLAGFLPSTVGIFSITRYISTKQYDFQCWFKRLEQSSFSVDKNWLEGRELKIRSFWVTIIHHEVRVPSFWTFCFLIYRGWRKLQLFPNACGCKKKEMYYSLPPRKKISGKTTIPKVMERCCLASDEFRSPDFSGLTRTSQTKTCPTPSQHPSFFGGGTIWNFLGHHESIITFWKTKIYT